MSKLPPPRRQRGHTTYQRSKHTQRRTLPPWVYWSILALAALITVGLTAWLVATQRVDPVVRIQTVECQQTDGSLCSATVQQALDTLRGQPLLFSRLATDLTSLLEPTGVTLLTYHRVLPNRLSVTVEPLPLAWALVTTTNQPLLALTQTGQVASLTAIKPQTPRVIVTSDQLVQQLSSNQTPTWLAPALLALRDWSITNNSQVSAVTITSPFDLLIQLSGQPFVIQLNPQELALNLNRLSYILKSDFATQSATASGSLDVRFRVPVLRSAP